MALRTTTTHATAPSPEQSYRDGRSFAVAPQFVDAYNYSHDYTRQLSVGAVSDHFRSLVSSAVDRPGSAAIEFLRLGGPGSGRGSNGLGVSVALSSGRGCVGFRTRHHALEPWRAWIWWLLAREWLWTRNRASRVESASAGLRPGSPRSVAVTTGECRRAIGVDRRGCAYGNGLKSA